MQHDLHHGQAVKASSHIVDHDTRSFGETFEAAYRWRLHDIESSKKYKAQQQRFPRCRHRDQGNELTGNFVDHYKLRVFHTTGPGHPGGSRNSGKYCHTSY